MQIAAKMRHLSTQTNLLQIEVESKNMQKKRYVWRKIDDENVDVPDFPRYIEVGQTLHPGTYGPRRV